MSLPKKAIEEMERICFEELKYNPRSAGAPIYQEGFADGFTFAWQHIEELRGALEGLTGVDSIKSVTDDGEEEWWLSAQEISWTVDESIAASIQRFGESKKESK